MKKGVTSWYNEKGEKQVYVSICKIDVDLSFSEVYKGPYTNSIRLISRKNRYNRKALFTKFYAN